MTCQFLLILLTCVAWSAACDLTTYRNADEAIRSQSTDSDGMNGALVRYNSKTAHISLHCVRTIDFDKDTDIHGQIEWFYSHSDVLISLRGKVGHVHLRSAKGRLTDRPFGPFSELSTLQIQPNKFDVVCCHGKQQYHFLLEKIEQDKPVNTTEFWGNLVYPGMPVMLTWPQHMYGYASCYAMGAGIRFLCETSICVNLGSTLHLRCWASDEGDIVWRRRLQGRKDTKVERAEVIGGELAIRIVSYDDGGEIYCDHRDSRRIYSRIPQGNRYSEKRSKYASLHRPFDIRPKLEGETTTGPIFEGPRKVRYMAPSGEQLINISCRMDHLDNRIWFSRGFSKSGPIYGKKKSGSRWNLMYAYNFNAPDTISVPVVDHAQTYVCLARSSCGANFTLSEVVSFIATTRSTQLHGHTIESGPKHGNNNATLYSVGGVGVCFGLLLMGLVVSLYRRKKNTTKQAVQRIIWMDEHCGSGIGLKNPIVNVVGGINLYEYVSGVDFSIQGILPFQLPRNSMSICERIGSGQFGVVYRAYMDQEGCAVKVAVKMLKTEDAIEADLLDFLREMKVMEQLDHPNVIKMVGSCVEQAPYYLVMEYCDYGCLKSLVEQPHLLSDDNGYVLPTISLTVKLDFAAQIANGMAYLESIKCVHRDLACRNILVGGEKSCKVIKISDFGLARNATVSEPDTNDAYYRMTIDRGMPIRWMAPESLTKRISTSKSDVWSFGVTVWELISDCRKPYGELENDRVAHHIIHGGRLNYSHFSDNVRLVLNSCLETDPDDRPTFHDLRFRLAPWLGMPANGGNIVETTV